MTNTTSATEPTMSQHSCGRHAAPCLFSGGHGRGISIRRRRHSSTTRALSIQITSVIRMAWPTPRQDTNTVARQIQPQQRRSSYRDDAASSGACPRVWTRLKQEKGYVISVKYGHPLARESRHTHSLNLRPYMYGSWSARSTV